MRAKQAMKREAVASVLAACAVAIAVAMSAVATLRVGAHEIFHARVEAKE